MSPTEAMIFTAKYMTLYKIIAGSSLFITIIAIGAMFKMDIENSCILPQVTSKLTKRFIKGFSILYLVHIVLIVVEPVYLYISMPIMTLTFIWFVELPVIISYLKRG